VATWVVKRSLAKPGQGPHLARFRRAAGYGGPFYWPISVIAAILAEHQLVTALQGDDQG
jgi:hypothetical protein